MPAIVSDLLDTTKLRYDAVMIPSAKILEYVLDALGHVYQRPSMYGETAVTVETVVNLYHDLWSVIVDRQNDFIKAKMRTHAEEEANADSFSNNFARMRPESTELGRMEYAISRWKQIDELLGLTLPTSE